jgi:chemosensory pili system protein ChpA (sensor histidine kinase/response regulator)
VILLSNGSDTVAIHVDQVLGNQETVVKPISTAIMRIPGLSSATLLNDGQLCLILDPVQLWVSQNNVLETLVTQSNTAFESAVPAVVLGSTAPSHYTLGSQRLTIDPAPAAMVQVVSTQMTPVIQTTMPERLRKWVMVVDDSLTVRKVTEKLLKREGWEVLLAKDGIDALEQLQANKPSVMLVDIEMPRMDGFDLTRNIRADDKLKAIPIIMITSRIADKHRDHAFSLGVNAYMGKPYRDDELLAEMIKLTTVSTAQSLVV